MLFSDDFVKVCNSYGKSSENSEMSSWLSFSLSVSEYIVDWDVSLWKDC